MSKVFTILLLIQSVFLWSCSNSADKEFAQPENGVSDLEIVLGSSSALSGHAGFLGTQYIHGALAYFKEVNAEGGINGRNIRVVSLDDQYNPAKTIANTQKLISEEKVFALFNYVGTPTSIAVKPIISSSEIPILGFFTGAEGLRFPLDANFFHLRDSYYQEAEGAIAYFVDQQKIKKIGVLYQQDAFGIAVLKGIQLALKRRNLEPVVTDTFQRGSLDVSASINWIFKEEVDAVMMVGTYAPLAKFVKMAHDGGYNPYFSTVSFVGSSAFAQELVEVQKIDLEYYEKIMVTQVVPSPYSTNYSATSEYIALSSEYFPEDSPNYVAFEGFLNAKVIVEGLRNAGREVTHDKFKEELLKIKNFDIGIEKNVTYSEDNHEGLDGIYYSKLNNDGRFDTFTPKVNTE